VPGKIDFLLSLLYNKLYELNAEKGNEAKTMEEKEKS